MADSVDNTAVSSTASVKHEFSSPWEDSDLVFVVEDHKLHVHRFMLKMASPVFKAMLESDFKEKEAAEILLPGKKADDVIVLLKQIYPQFNRSSMTLDNVENIYKLADEYQMESVAAACREVLKSVEKTKKNAMGVLLKAQVCQADEALQQCCDILQQLTLDELERNECFEDLDGPSARSILLAKARHFEKLLQKIPSNILGLFGCVFNLLRQSNQGGPINITECSIHSRAHKLLAVDVVRCKNCKLFLAEMCRKFCTYRYYQNSYGSEICVGKNIVELLEEIFTLLQG